MGKGLILGLLVALLAIAAVAALLWRPATVIGASEKSLAYSLRQEADSDARSGCEGEDDEFSCAIASAAGPVAYEVSVDDYGCWDAAGKRSGVEGELPATLAGCITIVDLIRSED